MQCDSNPSKLNIFAPMSQTDIINLLPDHIANQIAAGEVIQRPASAVKELMENSIDAGASEIQLIVNDAGKALVQVIDNGKGMSPTDARMAFERHATSKISKIEDLFNLRTMGFRGEALASIAAVAQVEIKSRRAEDELGIFIMIQDSEVQIQEAVQCAQGTSICMKNVFFNVPARRNFLKSNTTELRNIIEEFTRIALAFPNIRFTMHSNGQQVFNLEKGSQKQRMLQLMGNHYNSKLVPIQEDTDYLIVRGFVGKPETARKTRGDQYFFVNNRYIRSPYLHHAVVHAFEDMIAKDSYPSYVLFLDLDPDKVDINVHPTKQEIKFEDEKVVYAFVQAAVKHALAQFSIAPTLDFSLNADIQSLDAINKPASIGDREQTLHSQLYQSFTLKHQAHKIDPSASGFQPWKEIKDQHKEIREAVQSNSTTPAASPGWESDLARLSRQFHQNSSAQKYAELEYENRPVSREQRFRWLDDLPLIQLHKSFIIAPTSTGYIMVNQQHAHERVLYEQMHKALQGKPMAAQQSLFPITIELLPADAVIMQELLPDLQALGYKIEDFGQNSFVIHGTPADLETGNEQKAMEQLLERYKNFNAEIRFSRREKLLRTLAWQQSIKSGRPMGEKEMKSLLEQLFLCQTPQTTPSGRPTFITYTLENIESWFM